VWKPIAHFFQLYKDLEKGKRVSGVRRAGAGEAEALIHAAMMRHEREEGLPRDDGAALRGGKDEPAQGRRNRRTRTRCVGM
jgi:hypothetical protein